MTSPPSKEVLNVLNYSDKIVVYGAGSVAEEVIRIINNRTKRVVGVIDPKSKKKEICGYPVAGLDDENCILWKDLDIPLVVGIFNAFIDLDALKKRLLKFGWKTVITFTELHSALYSELGDRYWLTKRDFYASHKQNLENAFTLLTDDSSRNLFKALIKYRTHGDASDLPTPDIERQYFAKDLPAWIYPLRLIDCGACNGDTLDSIRKLDLNINEIYAFEPELDNFKNLLVKLAILRKNGVKAYGFPCGVSSDTATLKFSGSGLGGALSEGGDHAVPVVDLDSMFANFNFSNDCRSSLIKMDIEGSEYDALLGGRKIIHDIRPGLAISVFHKPSDLWELPLLIDSWNLGYDLYLRSHQYNGFDVVLYAIPK